MNKIHQLLVMMCLVGLMFGLPAQAQNLDLGFPISTNVVDDEEQEPPAPEPVIGDEEPPPDATAGDCNVVYAVHDDGLNDTQFVTIGKQQVEKLGSIRLGLDIEGLDVKTTGEVYVSSGDDGAQPGHLYHINPNTGDVNPVGDICFDFPGNTGEELAPGLNRDYVCAKEVSSITFNPVDDSLWGWAEECGLVKIDTVDPLGSKLVFAYPKDKGVTCLTKNPPDVTPIVEDMTWNNNGTKIYFAMRSEVWVYDPLAANDTEAVQLVANMGRNVEALEMFPEFDDKLLVGLHNSPTLTVLDLTTKTFRPSPVAVNEFVDIEAIGTCLGDDTVPPLCIMDEETGWMYTKDSINDSTGPSPEYTRVRVGNSYFEIYGLAVKMDDDTVTVAINSRLPMGGISYHGAQITWGDIVFDFVDIGKKYGVRFDSSNDSLAPTAPVGLYEVTETKSVSKANKGHKNFTTYKNYVERRGGYPSLGDMSIINNGYFGNTSQMPTSIKTGIKIVDDGFEMLNATQLAAKGLDFVTNLGMPASNGGPYSNSNQKPADVLGEYVIGFSFKRQADMTGDFVAHLFTECGNDGIVMMGNASSCF